MTTSLPTAEGLPRKAAFALLLAAIVAGALLRTGAAVSHARVDFDEGRYLDNAVSLIDGGGFATRTVSFFFGDPARPPRPEDISSPLYPMLLAVAFSVTGASFVVAKAIGVAVSTLMIPATFLLGRRLFGEGAALAAAGLVALQPDQAIVGAWAMTEPFYGILVLLTLLVAAPIVLEGPWTWKQAVAAGLMCGILYLSRQNGAAVAVALALLVTIDPAGVAGPLRRRLGMTLLMAAAAFVLCLPWFARNTVQLGSPTSSPLKNVAWAEHARSLYDPSVEDPSMQGYVERHGREGLARNIARRIVRVTRTLLTAEAGPFRWFAIAGLLAPFVPRLRGRSLLLLLPTALSAVMLLAVATWSGALPRYFLPLRALLYLSGAALLADLFSRAADRFGLRPRAASLAAALVAAGLGWAILSSHEVYAGYLARDDSARHEAAMEASRWLIENTAPDDVILEGGLLHQYAWLHRRGVVWIPLGGLKDVPPVAERYRAGYFAVTVEALRFRPEIAVHWRIHDGRMEAGELPAWLTPVHDRGGSGVIIYRIEEAP